MSPDPRTATCASLWSRRSSLQRRRIPDRRYRHPSRPHICGAGLRACCYPRMLSKLLANVWTESLARVRVTCCASDSPDGRGKLRILRAIRPAQSRFAPAFPQVVAIPFRPFRDADIVASLSRRELQMFSEMINTYGPATIAAAVLVPVLLGHIPTFCEG